MSEKELYETPRLSEIGDIAELTKQCGWGIQELFASMVGSGRLEVDRSCRASGSCVPSFS